MLDKENRGLQPFLVEFFFPKVDGSTAYIFTSKVIFVGGGEKTRSIYLEEMSILFKHCFHQ